MEYTTDATAYVTSTAANTTGYYAIGTDGDYSIGNGGNMPINYQETISYLLARLAENGIDDVKIEVCTASHGGLDFIFPNGKKGNIWDMNLSPQYLTGVLEWAIREHGYAMEDLRSKLLYKERRETMITLGEVVDYLGNYLKTEEYPNGIAVGSDFGNHVHCFLDTNCPEAVKLRKMIEEAGLDWKEIAKKYQEVAKIDKPQPIRFDSTEYNGKALINVAGQTVEVDISAELERQLKGAFRAKMEDLKYAQMHITDFGSEMYRTYVRTIRDTRMRKELPQLKFPIQTLMRYRCLTAMAGPDSYYFVLPFDYFPQYIYTGGTRYKMNKKHIEELHRSVHIVFQITLQHIIVNVFLVDSEFKKFRHYHGRESDCWGELHWPEQWDGSIDQLVMVAKKFQTAITTINRDSLMTDRPSGMRDIHTLMKKSKKLGKENEIEPGAQEPEEVLDEDADETPRREWHVERPDR